jgi:hypothetical protein
MTARKASISSIGIRLHILSQFERI